MGGGGASCLQSCLTEAIVICRSDYTPAFYQNGKDSSPPTSVEHFSFSDLPNLDFGSPDEDEGGVS